MRIMKQALLFFVIALGFSAAFGQKSIRDSSITMGMLGITYQIGQPGGDLMERFGLTNQVGGEFGVKLSNNFYGYAGAKFLFGGNVREAVARNIVQVFGNDSTGYSTMALGADGRFYTVRFFERGITIPFAVGKIFPLSKKGNRNSGIYLEVGGQFIQHKIAIQAIGDNVPNLSKPYLKGYDRLTNGFGVTEGIGYRYFGNNLFTNFAVGLDFSQNFTKSRRDLNFDTGEQDTANRLDLLYNIKVSWTFPIYRSAPESEYYY